MSHSSARPPPVPTLRGPLWQHWHVIHQPEKLEGNKRAINRRGWWRAGEGTARTVSGVNRVAKICVFSGKDQPWAGLAKMSVAGVSVRVRPESGAPR